MTAEPVHARYNVLRQAHGNVCSLTFSFNGTDIEGKVVLVLRHLRDPEVAKTEVLFIANRWDSAMRVKSTEHVRIGEKRIVEAAWIRIAGLSIASSRTTDVGDVVADTTDERMIDMLEALASDGSPSVGFRFAGDQAECSIQIANRLSARDARDLRKQVKLWKAKRALLMN